MNRVYFTDRDLGKQFPAILAAAGFQVERHHDLFAPDGTDEQWLQYCGAKRRIAITHDQRIRHKVNEREAVMQHGVALLVVIGKSPHPELARQFVATLPKIEAFLAAHTPPFIAKVYRAPAVKAATLHAASGLTAKGQARIEPVAAGTVALWYPPAKRP